jgi:hypothetical protein
MMAFTRFTYLPHSDDVVVPGVVFPLFYFDTDTGRCIFGYEPPAVPAGDPVMFSVNGEMHVEQCLRLTEQTITTDEPGFGKFYAGEDHKPHFLAGNGMDYDLALAGDYSRAQMTACGSHDIVQGYTYAVPYRLPFGAGFSDGSNILFHGAGVIEVLQTGYYRLSFNLPFESAASFLVGCSPGACWYSSMDGGVTWAPLPLTRTFDTVHGDRDDNGTLSLPPVDLLLSAGTWLMVGGFDAAAGAIPASPPAWVNGYSGEGGVYNEAWARVEQGSVSVVPVAGSIIAGTTGGYARRLTEVLATLSGASTTIAIPGIFANTKILGVQLRVDDLITFGGGGATWSAAFSGGSFTALALAQLPAKNTKANKMLVGEVASAAVNIVVTPNAGTFSGGNLRAIVYYEQLDAMADVP